MGGVGGESVLFKDTGGCGGQFCYRVTGDKCITRPSTASLTCVLLREAGGVKLDWDSVADWAKANSSSIVYRLLM